MAPCYRQRAPPPQEIAFTRHMRALGCYRRAFGPTAKVFAMPVVDTFLDTTMRDSMVRHEAVASTNGVFFD